jgi:hypothetical protein
VRYRNYCKSKFGRVIDFPFLVTAASEEAARDRCKELWCNRYPTQPFNDIISQLTLTESNRSDERSDEQAAQSELESELVATIARQSTFYYQVS